MGQYGVTGALSVSDCFMSHSKALPNPNLVCTCATEVTNMLLVMYVMYKRRCNVLCGFFFPPASVFRI